MNDWKPTLLDLPSAADDWAPFVRQWTDTNLGVVEGATLALTSGGPRVRSAEEIMGLLNDSDRALRNASSFVELLSEVHPDEAVRSIAEESRQRAINSATERGQNRALYEVLAAVDPDELEPDAQRVLEKTLLDFRRSGVNLGDDDRERFREIVDRSTVIDQEFSRIIRDDVRSIRIAPDGLAGLPDDYIAAHPADADGLVTITTDYPDLIPFRMFAQDADARRELQIVFLNRGWPENDALLGELLELRGEQAKLLDYESWPDFDAELKMIKTGGAIEDFIEKLGAAASPAGSRDRAVLLARLREDRPEATDIDAADSAYYTELVRREMFNVDSQELRGYFDSAKVQQGLLDVTGRLLGLEYRAVPNGATWHPDVDVYEVLMGGGLIGRIHLDLHPREGKFKHAAMFEITAGIADAQLAEGALACNLPTGLMEHSDVVTLFHEFGHLVHHILAHGQRFAALAGIATEWDFVEAPSQMLEEWAWDADVLRTFAINGAGDAIPAELVARMRLADEFGNGIGVRTQTFYSAVSYFLHRDRPKDRTADIVALQNKYSEFAYLPDTHFQANFGHLTGYSSAYYTYMWSQVIAKDLFSAFNPADLFDQKVAVRYRDLILAKGGSADAADLVRDFLGRDYSFEAFAAWLNAGGS
ncbi:MAG TPA: M3 family metallopeptidase [Galbitalea sp.]|nr:M3 family metallopeptidase [Galbitalea sp.]